jgi:ketosteroid isomerase-like protein
MNPTPAVHSRRSALRLACLSLILPALSLLRAADDNVIAAVRSADNERVAATKAGDRARLDAIYSNDLHYAHSNGKIDSKSSYVESLVRRSTVYEKYDYQTRDFRVAAPGIVLMTGRVLIHSTSSGAKQQNDLNFLAVWREENGRWRFLGWQSCKNPPADTAKK